MTSYHFKNEFAQREIAEEIHNHQSFSKLQEKNEFEAIVADKELFKVIYDSEYL